MSEPLIVVPLDCSELSESAVPYASAMAQATGAHLLLLTIWEEGERALITDLPDLAEDLFKRGEEHYEGYLAGVAKKVEAEGVEVEADVLLGDPTEEILRAIEQRDPRLLVMATHGRSGLSRWRYGSVASKLAREAPVPTMMVGPNVVQDGARVDAVRRILVPLDGSPLAESAIRPALELAEALDAGLLLAQVLSWANQAFVYGAPDYAVQDVDIARIDRELTAGAQQYLARIDPARCRQHVLRRFSPSIMAKRYRAIYTALLDRTARQRSLAPASAPTLAASEATHAMCKSSLRGAAGAAAG